MAFDEHMAEDLQQVLDTAAVLDITEFQVFRMAYESWYGEMPSEAVIEPFFAHYMFREIVPPWVRRFTRYVMDLYAQGRLDPAEFGIHKCRPTPEMWSRGTRYLLALVLIMSSLVLVAKVTADLITQLGICYFPPCY